MRGWNAEGMLTGRAYATSLSAPAAVAFLALVPAAHGQGLSPQAAVTLTRGSEVRECQSLLPRVRPCGLLGSREATVSWATSCAPQLPEESRETKVTILARPPSPTEWEYGSVAVEDDLGSLPLAASGTASFTLLPGWRLYAAASVGCTDFTSGGAPPVPSDDPLGGNGGPEPEPRSEQATAESATISAPPRLVAAVRTGGTYCIRPPQTPQSLEGKLQAGQASGLELFIRFATLQQHPLVGNPGRAEASTADYARLRLYASGAGIKVSTRPNRRALRDPSRAVEMKVKPKRAGKLRLWATADGLRTNAKTIRVVRGC